MIHNTFLIRISTSNVIATTQYWPVDVSEDALNEFITTREELRTEHNQVPELPLIIGDHKFLGKDWIEDSVLVFVTDKAEDEGDIFEKIDQALKALRLVYTKKGIEGVVASYGRLIEPSVTTRLKIALVGEGGVGKTTTLHLLLGDTPPLQYVPTIALNLETVENIRFGNYSLVLWDFAGQERFRTLWRFYFHGADVIFLVCDSTLRNVIISKDILKLIKRDAPKVPVFAMANKQDKPTAMKPEVVQKILGIPTYPMVAIDKERRDEMLRILMTAASHYVGVALPDLPASELLKFTDAATEEVISEAHAEEEIEAAEGEEEEYETVIEEVYVDEEGHILDNIDDYEVIEEVEEVEIEEEVEGQEGEEEAIEAEAEVQAEAESEEIIEIPEEEATSIEIEPEEEFEVIT
ncbi:MAG: ADP-ribosylation factor-like protein, partial [Promethearchaeota archaeon]